MQWHYGNMRMTEWEDQIVVAVWTAVYILTQELTPVHIASPPVRTHQANLFSVFECLVGQPYGFCIQV